MAWFGFGPTPLADTDTYRRLALKMVFPMVNRFDVGSSRATEEDVDRMFKETSRLRRELIPTIEDPHLTDQVEHWLRYYEGRAREWASERKRRDADMRSYDERRRLEEEQVKALAEKLNIRY